MGTIISISSQVVRGHVGNSVTVFVCQRLGHDVWPVNTVILPFHPGYGPARRIVTAPDDLAAALNAIGEKGFLSEIDAVVSGYLAGAGQAEAVAALVGQVKAANSKALYLCDPILGDDGAIYVSGDVAQAVREQLVPLPIF